MCILRERWGPCESYDPIRSDAWRYRCLLALPCGMSRQEHGRDDDHRGEPERHPEREAEGVGEQRSDYRHELGRDGADLAGTATAGGHSVFGQLSGEVLRQRG